MGKQLEISGTERHIEAAARLNISEEAALQCQNACEDYVTIMTKRAELSKKEAQAKANAMAVLRAHNLEEYKYWDDRAGVYRPIRIDTSYKLIVDKDGEHTDTPGEAVDDVDPSELGSDSILADAAKTQSDAGVAENDDGDVVPTDKAAPKSKRRGPRKGKGK